MKRTFGRAEEQASPRGTEMENGSGQKEIFMVTHRKEQNFSDTRKLEKSLQVPYLSVFSLEIVLLPLQGMVKNHTDRINTNRQKESPTLCSLFSDTLDKRTCHLAIVHKSKHVLTVN